MEQRTILRTLTGEPDFVIGQLTRLQASGRLVSGTHLARRADGTVATVVCLRSAQPGAATKPRLRLSGWPWPILAPFAGLVLALLAGVVWLVWTVVAWIVAHWAVVLVCVVAALAVAGSVRSKLRH